MSVESDGRAPADILAGASYVGLVVTGFFARGFELADFPNAVRIHRETKRAKFFRDLRFCRRKPSGAGIWLREDGEDGLAGLLDVVARRAHCKQLFRRRIESRRERRMSWRDEIKRNRGDHQNCEETLERRMHKILLARTAIPPCYRSNQNLRRLRRGAPKTNVRPVIR